jgi:proline dehydrogenase
MPGETVEDALSAAEQLRPKFINTILTHLGENIADDSEARAVVEHYLHVLDLVHARGLDAYVSVKPTQLGMDLGTDTCRTNLFTILDRAASLNQWVWIDMEQSAYVDRTLTLYTDARAQYTKVGVCVQSYLRRTRDDVRALLPLSPTIRLVKGAYKEPSSIAFAKKSDVDRNFFELSKLMLESRHQNNVNIGIATHDTALIAAVNDEARRLGLSKQDYEFQFLYGIEQATQLRLARDGYRMRVLISYGEHWFPWYMRRLAERPANVFFVLKKMFSR